MGRVIRTGDGGLSLKAWILGSLAAQSAQVPSRLPRLPLLVEAVARAFAGEKGGDDVPPEVGRFTTSVASASPSTSSAMMSSGLPLLAICSSSGSRSFIELIFFSLIRM